MSPLLYIGLLVLVLVLLLYWLLNSQESGAAGNGEGLFKFEAAPELAIYAEKELYLGENSIKIAGSDPHYRYVYWNLSQERLTECTNRLGIRVENAHLVLRLYEGEELLASSDLPVRARAGRCKLQIRPGQPYRLVLGIRNKNRFIPILASQQKIAS